MFENAMNSPQCLILIENDRAVPSMKLFCSCLSMRCIPCVRCLCMKIEKCLHQEWNLTNHFMKWHDSLFQMKGSPPPSPEKRQAFWNAMIHTWNEKTHTLKWNDSFPQLKRCTAWSETAHPLKWNDSPLMVWNDSPSLTLPLRRDDSLFEEIRFIPWNETIYPWGAASRQSKLHESNGRTAPITMRLRQIVCMPLRTEQD